jgi:hypothetical protein
MDTTAIIIISVASAVLLIVLVVGSKKHHHSKHRTFHDELQGEADNVVRDFIHDHEAESQDMFKEKTKGTKHKISAIKRIGVLAFVLIIVVTFLVVTIMMSMNWIKIFTFWQGYKLSLVYHFPALWNVFQINAEYAKGIGIAVVLEKDNPDAGEDFTADNYKLVGDAYQGGANLCDALRAGGFVNSSDPSKTIANVMVGVSSGILGISIIATILCIGLCAEVTIPMAIGSGVAICTGIGMLGMSIAGKVQADMLPDQIEGTSLECY